jgi:monofunctional biosynthetic peptidoglycan transglycosylase
VSRSGFGRDPRGWLHFAGMVRPEYNGGFASVEARWQPVDLSAHDGLRLRVRGDGQRYTVYLRDAGGPIVYQAKFDTVAGVWQTTDLPYTAFAPVWFGQRVIARRLAPRTIQGMSLMIEDKQFGSFTLEVAQIGLFNSAL